MTHNITVIRGDGVGPEVCDAAMRVIEAAGVNCQWDFALVGSEAEKEFGTPLPAETIKKVRASRVALKGPVIIEKMGDKVVISHDDGIQNGQGAQRVYSNANTAMRIELGAYVNVRPLRAFEGVQSHAPKLDVVVIRELTEDLYSGYEHCIGTDAAEAIKITTRKATERAARFAFEYATQRWRRRLSIIHKANVLQLTDGLFLRTAREVAKDYPKIKCDDAMIDSCVYHLASKPEGWDVLLMANQYGDIISDLCAGLVGSFGLAPGASFGDDVAIFEAAHGAALDLAGQNRVNPAALILCGAMMMEHLGELEAAQRIRDAVKAVIKHGRILTPDLGGTAKTTAMTNVIIDHL
ncbi:MAG: isocitrate/isopropylmalate dehydrogenase family protein [Blastocatellia bacterium]